jgi:hypothetical protein
MASYRFLIRMLTLPLDREQWQQILHIAHNNNFPTNRLTQLKLRIQRSISQPEPPSPTSLGNCTKWATFTYTSPQISKVTNIFKPTLELPSNAIALSHDSPSPTPKHIP